MPVELNDRPGFTQAAYFVRVSLQSDKNVSRETLQSRAEVASGALVLKQ
jgi:hypothetical protein